MPQRNLAVELLQKLLKGEIRTRAAQNVVQARSFAELLEQAVRTLPEPRHRDGAGDRGADRSSRRTCAQAERARRGARALSEDELAFYDALETNDSAVKVLGDETLRDDRPRAGRDGAQERHHRLDGPRERPRAAARAREAHPAQVRLPAGQAGEGDADRAGAGGGALRGLGGGVKKAPHRCASLSVTAHIKILYLYKKCVDSPQGGRVGRV